MVAVSRDELHRYWIAEPSGAVHQALGVTRALVGAGLVDDTYFSDRVRGRGKLAHVFAQKLATNTLDGPIDAAILPYMIGLRRFLDKYGPTIHNAEVMLGNLARLLAGTVDLDVTMLGGPGAVELKLSQPTQWHGLQLAPYSYLLDGAKWLGRARWGLYLTERGGYRLKEYDDPTDLEVFFRAHELLHWRVKHGTYERPYGRSERGSDNGDHALHDEDRDGGSRLDGDLARW